MLANLPLIVTSVGLNALAQIFLRKGMLTIGSPTHGFPLSRE